MKNLIFIIEKSKLKSKGKPLPIKIPLIKLLKAQRMLEIVIYN